ncbi:ABC transporter [Colletotrichum graminicola M1.001]|uniref:ABC transporter n=1 Tax=Colletotrichum graminicola (strain M1.001 / M2 / FGSC 10212) TaxID=645133 RepID=E3QJ45_COLGM|nr:ABC transporter [Colletotrichum graminicola M1.001]EFQ30883.1 ABC transporter [Colletotrichum graminicola M1.001]
MAAQRSAIWRQNLNNPQNDYGIAEPRPIRSLQDGLSAAGASRSAVVFVNNGLSGGAIDRVIDSFSEEVTRAGKNSTKIEKPSDISRICRSSFRATTSCYGAVIFHSSPNEGDGGIWNYTLRGDAAFGSSFKVKNDNNDVQIYTLPLQRAVDSAIVRTNSTEADPSPLSNVREWGFTGETEEERQASVRRRYQQTIIDYLGVSFVLALIGVSYHVPGHIATEREKGLSQLIDAMMSTRYEWEAQVVRILSSFYSFASIYFPGWVVASVVSWGMIWKESSIGIVLVFFVLAGLALTSQAILGASFFKKAQLSGVINSLVYVLLGVLAQALPNESTGAVTVLSLLFTPCAFVFFIKSISRYEADGKPMNLLQAPPNGPSTLPAFVERQIHGVGSESRKIYKGEGVQPQHAVTINGLTKVYFPSIFRRAFSRFFKARPPIVAVNNLDLTVKRGEILALLGANGSGKSTALDAISGISRFNQGSVHIDASGGIGIAPQKNVLWDELTVTEHIRIFNQLKSPVSVAGKEDQNQLIDAIGLATKHKSQSKTLSGGQKRKLQLGMMLTGGSAVCCVDEVSSGIDALSRRKIWDILLSERGKRTIILTTHFLDEADLLADNIAILSKGSLKAEGSSVALKNALGDGYRIHVLNVRDVRAPPEVSGVALTASSMTIVYTAPSSSLAADVIRALEARQIPYRISSPNIEDVFLRVAEKVQGEDLQPLQPGAPRVSTASGQNLSEKSIINQREGDTLGLQSGHQTGFFKQTRVLVHKRLVLFKTNWIPYVIAFITPIIAAAIMQLLVVNEGPTSCDPADVTGSGDLDSYREAFEEASVAAGPWSDFSTTSFDDMSTFLDPTSNDPIGTINIYLSDSYQDVSRFIEDNIKNITPGGIWVGSQETPPTIAYRADDNMISAAVIVQNLFNVVRSNASIFATYTPFDSVIPSSTLTTAQLAIYFSIVLYIIPSFFGLYPNMERRNHVRGLQYSSGVRSLPLWTSHLIFDFGVFFIPLLAAAIIFAVSSDIWYASGYLFPVFLFYGITSILLSYVISLFTNSQVATFAAIMAYNSVGFAIYLIAFLYIITFSPAVVTERNILIGHYTISAFFPITSICRAILIGLNTFSLACSGTGSGNPGSLSAYGGPIMYLSIQAIILFTLDNVSFGVHHGEVFALLGPNGAGKSTAVSLIRGDIQPSGNGGDVFVEKVSITNQRALARSNLGVCPQFDAIDSMTVVEHLRHYAKLRGISDVEQQVQAVVRAVGLQAHVNVMAQHLSGGNKRKLSLGIALTGNPSVILFDEPSSGLDAAAKRIMWRTLSTIVSGRSILLTTHSMEEADALANRACIIAQRMLAIGEVEQLQSRFGDSLYVHLASRSAPHSTPGEMEHIRQWVVNTFPSARVEDSTYHGQIRFSVSASDVLQRAKANGRNRSTSEDERSFELSAIGQLIIMLEDNKEVLGIEHHSVSPTTLNDVFLAIVGQHDVQEEGYGAQSIEKKKINWQKIVLGFCRDISRNCAVAITDPLLSSQVLRC